MIKIDMEMPESCEKCGLFAYLSYYVPVCRINNTALSVDPVKEKNKRSKDCPLIAVAE